MEGEVFVVTIVAIACASGLIKAWINRKNNQSGVDEQSFNRLAKAFMQHKKEMRERVQNLERSITRGEKEGKNVKQQDSYPQIEDSERNKRSLSNDLQNKNKVRS